MHETQARLEPSLGYSREGILRASSTPPSLAQDSIQSPDVSEIVVAERPVVYEKPFVSETVVAERPVVYDQHILFLTSIIDKQVRDWHVANAHHTRRSLLAASAVPQVQPHETVASPIDFDSLVFKLTEELSQLSWPKRGCRVSPIPLYHSHVLLLLMLSAMRTGMSMDVTSCGSMVAIGSD